MQGCCCLPKARANDERSGHSGAPEKEDNVNEKMRNEGQANETLASNDGNLRLDYTLILISYLTVT